MGCRWPCAEWRGGTESHGPAETGVCQGQRSIWLRRMGSLQAQPLAGAEGASYAFWSPDSRYIVSGSDDKTLEVWQPK